MPNKCSVPSCFTNYKGHDKGTVFGLPKDEATRDMWIKFVNRKDSSSLKHIYICENHFEERFLSNNENRVRLRNSLKPVPTIFTESQSLLPTSVLPTVTKQRRPPTQRVFQHDQAQCFAENDAIQHFSNIDNTLLKNIGFEFQFCKFRDHAIFYSIEENSLSAPEIAECIYITSDLHVKLFYKASPVPLPSWFTKGRNAILSRKSMLENFPAYIRQEASKNYSVLDEIRRLKFLKRPIYSANLLRYAILLRYTSLASYKLLLEEFKLPSISLLKKVTAGKINVLKAAKLLKDSGSISEDVMLLFDEIHLQKCEEFVGGDVVGADNNGILYKGAVCFMIVGLKSNIPYVVKTCPEKEIHNEWLKEEILECLTVLQGNNFNVRGVVCDDHSSNVAAYRSLLYSYNSNPEQSYIWLNGKKIYLLYDSVHLIKNVRNNLLDRKRFIFPKFSSSQLLDEVKVEAGEIRWRLFHEVHEKDQALQGNIKAAVQLNAQALHPGNCKQSVPPALAIFHPTTSAAIKTYFPDRIHAANFLNLFNTWWIISNSKNRFNTGNRLGDAAKQGDNKPAFLREFADWIEQWDAMKIPKAERFTLSSQTSAALRATLRCQANLIEDLLSEGYDFVLTSRLQSDPIERRFGQYRQMSGGRFLISLKDVICSENIIKIKSLIKEDIDITPEIKSIHDYSNDIQNLHCQVELLGNGMDIDLCEESKQVSDVLAGYIAHKAKPFCESCCYDKLLERDPSEPCSRYLSNLSRGGLKRPSDSLRRCVAQGFAYLDACSDIIRQSPLPARKAGEQVLERVINGEYLLCDNHKERMQRLIIRTVTNIFFNNQRKRVNESVVTDRVVAFKRNKRRKQD